MGKGDLAIKFDLNFYLCRTDTFKYSGINLELIVTVGRVLLLVRRDNGIVFCEHREALLEKVN